MVSARLSNIIGHLDSTTRVREFASMAMANLTIKSKYRMLSGYEIPALGYGVCFQSSNKITYNAVIRSPLCKIKSISLHLSKCGALLSAGLLNVHCNVMLKLMALLM